MKLTAITFLFFLHLCPLFGQIDKDLSLSNPTPVKRPNYLVGLCSVGSKNTYGVWGIFVGRSFEIGKIEVEMRLGCGTKNSLVVGGGVDVKVCSLKIKWIFLLPEIIPIKRLA